MTGPVYKRAVDLMEADVGNELVALEPEAGRCFGFSKVAASVWRSLEQPKSFDQLRHELLADYDVGAEQCARELRELLEVLQAKGLVAEMQAGGNNCC